MGALVLCGEERIYFLYIKVFDLFHKTIKTTQYNISQIYTCNIHMMHKNYCVMQDIFTRITVL